LKLFKTNTKKQDKSRSRSLESIKRKKLSDFSLIHEIQKLEPHLTASESLYDAQLKKKEIEMEIQMTTMKQKIEMMNNFKSIGSETQAKIDKAKEDQEKIKTRLGVL
jgi:hypothetical protein